MNLGMKTLPLPKAQANIGGALGSGTAVPDPPRAVNN